MSCVAGETSLSFKSFSVWCGSLSHRLAWAVAKLTVQKIVTLTLGLGSKNMYHVYFIRATIARIFRMQCFIDIDTIPTISQ